MMVTIVVNSDDDGGDDGGGDGGDDGDGDYCELRGIWLILKSERQ